MGDPGHGAEGRGASKALHRPKGAGTTASAGSGLRFHETTLQGAWLTEPMPVHDERGYFARTFCAREYADRDLVTHFVQHSTSYSKARGTVRGMHFQRAPHGEVKVVTCLKGAIWDVIIDLRRGSPSFMHWEGFRLSEDNRHRLYIPEGYAHGFQTLEPDTEVGYLISAFHVPEAAAGLRYDDPTFGIPWPLPPTAISARDLGWPDFQAS